MTAAVDRRRNVVLTGFMATGKSTVGRLLADRLGYGFVDTDAVIESRRGPIPQIFAEHGEGEFRRLERELATELAARRGLVIATGGRMLVDPDNAEVLGATGTVVCLTAPADTVIARVLADGVEGRPMLVGSDLPTRIRGLLAERESAYRRFTQVDTDDRSPIEVCEAVLEVVEARSDGAVPS
ncbi:MAG: Shikimate kinase/3-dehydroquinate synthase [Actinomycetota bacterium]